MNHKFKGTITGVRNDGRFATQRFIDRNKQQNPGTRDPARYGNGCICLISAVQSYVLARYHIATRQINNIYIQQIDLLT